MIDFFQSASDIHIYNNALENKGANEWDKNEEWGSCLVYLIHLCVIPGLQKS